MIYATFLSICICILIMLKLFFFGNQMYQFLLCSMQIFSYIKKIFSYPSYIKVNLYFLLIPEKFYFVYRSLVNLITMGDQPWIFIGRTDAEAEAPILWPPDVKSRLIGKDPDAGKDRRQEEKGWQWMRWLDGITDSMDMSLSKLWKIVKNREAWQCCSPWAHKELDTNERLNNKFLYIVQEIDLNLFFKCLCT